MAAHLVTHPSAEVLKAFGLGKLNDSTAAAIMSHLDSCPDCCKIVAALSGDDFLNRLRQERSHNSTSLSLRTLPEMAGGPKPAPNRPALADIPPELAANQQYEILRELGRGGMGVVYLAKNKLMDRLEVLKVVNKTLLDHPAAVERFLREIRSAAKLSHANVVTAYSAVQHGELLAFAMEYIEGQDLASLVKSQGPLSVPHACYYVQQAASGLQHAFEKQMVHRDIKPQNLILAREGKKHIVKVLDFGLAKLRSEKTEDTGLTGEGKMLGTPDYIAPEQTLDAAKADTRADIYSLGCTLYYLLSGHPPFSGSSLGAVLMAHQMQEAKPLNLVRPEVPEELAAVVRRMMTKTPAKRYQTPLEVVQALAPFVKQGATPKAPPELSVGAAESKAAVKKSSRVDPPPAQAAETPKQRPPVVWESLTERSASAGRQKGAVIRSNRQLASAKTETRKKWLLGGGLGVGVLLLALLGMWASGVFQAKTKDGTIVPENLPANAEASVDGERVTVKREEKAEAPRPEKSPPPSLAKKLDAPRVASVADDDKGSKPLDNGKELPAANVAAPAAAAVAAPPAPPRRAEDKAVEKGKQQNAAVPPSPRPESGLPPEAKAAAKAFEKARDDARAKFLDEFDKVLDRLAKVKGAPQQRLKIINVVKEEKKRFEDSGLIPFSEPMRPYLAKYFVTSKAAEEKLARVYNSLTDAQLRAKNESMVAELKADLENLLAARIVARWRHFVNAKLDRIVVLYSNGKGGRADPRSRWSYENGALYYKLPDPTIPGGFGIDKLQVSSDGLSYSGYYDRGRREKPIKVTGTYLKPD